MPSQEHVIQERFGVLGTAFNKYAIGQPSSQSNENQLWDAFERERVVATASTVFYGANEAFDFGNMLILRTEVELNVSNDCL